MCTQGFKFDLADLVVLFIWPILELDQDTNILMKFHEEWVFKKSD